MGLSLYVAIGFSKASLKTLKKVYFCIILLLGSILLQRYQLLKYRARPGEGPPLFGDHIV